MTDGRSASDDRRLFLALSPSEAAQSEIVALRSELERPDDGWRWLPIDAVHLTLRFLGPVTAERDEALRPVWRAAAAGCPRFAFRLAGIGVFPGPRRPSVLWVGAVETAGAGIMERLARAVEDAAREAAFVPETRPFRPHLTVARARRADRPRAPRSPFAGAAESEVRELGLYRSELLPGGARYTRLERFPLGAPAAPPPAEAGDRIA